MPGPRESNTPNRNRRRPESMPGGGWWWVVILVLAFLFMWYAFYPSAGTIAYSDFLSLAQKKYFAKVEIYGKAKAVGEFAEGKVDKLEDKEIKRKVRGTPGRIQTMLPESVPAC